MTPSAAAVIRTAPWKGLAIFGIVLACALAIGLTIAFIRDLTQSSPGSRDPLGNTVAVAITISFVALMCLVMWTLGVWLPARRDLREVTYLRTSGPIEVVKLKNGYFLRLADRNLTVNFDIGSALANSA